MTSPNQIEGQWHIRESQVLDFFSRRPEWLSVLATVLLLVIFYFSLWPLWQFSYPDWTRLNLTQDRTYPVIALILLSPLTLWIPRRMLGLFFAAVLLIAWTAPMLALKTITLSAYSFPLYVIGTGLICSILNRKLPKAMVICLMITLLGFLILMFLSGIVGTEQNSNFLKFFWTLHPQYALLALASVTLLSREKSSSLEYYLAPSILSNALPLPESTFFKPDLRNWWQGFFNILWGLVLVAALIALSKITTAQSTLTTAAFKYFYFCLYIMSALNICGGLLRIFGFQVPEATWFVLLSRHPLDFWRRSSCFLYEFVVNRIFLPIFRRTRSPLVSGLGTLVFVIANMFLIHEIGVKAFYSILFPQFHMSLDILTSTLSWIGKYVGSWLILILIWRKFFQKRIQDNSWTGVLLTHTFGIFLTYLLFQ